MIAPCPRPTALLLLLGLAACTTVAPFETVSPGVTVEGLPAEGDALPSYGATTTTPENAMPSAGDLVPPQLGTPTPTASPAPAAAPNPEAATTPESDEVALCYNRLASTPAQLRASASTACGGEAPLLIRQSLNLDVCPLAIPMRAVFACPVPGK